MAHWPGASEFHAGPVTEIQVADPAGQLTLYIKSKAILCVLQELKMSGKENLTFPTTIQSVMTDVTCIVM